MQHNTDYCEMNIDRLAHFLQKYGEVSKVYVAAFNRSGEQLTDFAKDDIEKECIDKLFSQKARQEIFRRVVDSEIEDQAIEDHAIPGVYIAASALKQDGHVSLVWLFFVVIESELTGDNFSEAELLDKIAKEFNGGGHTQASGFMSDLELDELKRLLIESVSKRL